MENSKLYRRTMENSPSLSRDESINMYQFTITTMKIEKKLAASQVSRMRKLVANEKHEDSTLENEMKTSIFL